MYLCMCHVTCICKNIVCLASACAQDQPPSPPRPLRGRAATPLRSQTTHRYGVKLEEHHLRRTVVVPGMLGFFHLKNMCERM